MFQNTPNRLKSIICEILMTIPYNQLISKKMFQKYKTNNTNAALGDYWSYQIEPSERLSSSNRLSEGSYFDFNNGQFGIDSDFPIIQKTFPNKINNLQPLPPCSPHFIEPSTNPNAFLQQKLIEQYLNLNDDLQQMPAEEEIDEGQKIYEECLRVQSLPKDYPSKIWGHLNRVVFKSLSKEFKVEFQVMRQKSGVNVENFENFLKRIKGQTKANFLGTIGKHNVKDKFQKKQPGKWAWTKNILVDWELDDENLECKVLLCQYTRWYLAEKYEDFVDNKRRNKHPNHFKKVAKELEAKIRERFNELSMEEFNIY